MTARKKKEPVLQVEEMPAAVEEITPEQAAAAEGGIIAVLIGLEAPQHGDKTAVITAARRGGRPHYHK